jgi:hypothetical protein
VDFRSFGFSGFFIGNIPWLLRNTRHRYCTKGLQSLTISTFQPHIKFCGDKSTEFLGRQGSEKPFVAGASANFGFFGQNIEASYLINHASRDKVYATQRDFRIPNEFRLWGHAKRQFLAVKGGIFPATAHAFLRHRRCNWAAEI